VKLGVVDDPDASNRHKVGAEELVSIHVNDGEVAKDIGEDTFQRPHKRAKPNPETSVHSSPLCSSPLDDLLEMLLGDEDLLEPLDIGLV
jgi:hypothetical protein